MCQLTKRLAAKIEPHISSAFRDLDMIFDIYILSRSPIMEDEDRAGNEESCYGTQNEQENTHNHVIEGHIRIYMTVDTDQKY